MQLQPLQVRTTVAAPTKTLARHGFELLRWREWQNDHWNGGVTNEVDCQAGFDFGAFGVSCERPGGRRFLDEFE